MLATVRSASGLRHIPSRCKGGHRGDAAIEHSRGAGVFSLAGCGVGMEALHFADGLVAQQLERPRCSKPRHRRGCCIHLAHAVPRPIMWPTRQGPRHCPVHAMVRISMALRRRAWCPAARRIVGAQQRIDLLRKSARFRRRGRGIGARSFRQRKRFGEQPFEPNPAFSAH